MIQIKDSYMNLVRMVVLIIMLNELHLSFCLNSQKIGTSPCTFFARYVQMKAIPGNVFLQTKIIFTSHPVVDMTILSKDDYE